jgi:hypothetical protein
MNTNVVDVVLDVQGIDIISVIVDLHLNQTRCGGCESTGPTAADVHGKAAVRAAFVFDDLLTGDLDDEITTIQIRRASAVVIAEISRDRVRVVGLDVNHLGQAAGYSLVWQLGEGQAGVSVTGYIVGYDPPVDSLILGPVQPAVELKSVVDNNILGCPELKAPKHQEKQDASKKQ